LLKSRRSLGSVDGNPRIDNHFGYDVWLWRAPAAFLSRGEATALESVSSPDFGLRRVSRPAINRFATSARYSQANPAIA
jgi:hypothetical protein